MGLVYRTTFALVFWLAYTLGEAYIREWAYIPFRNLAVLTLEINGVCSGKQRQYLGMFLKISVLKHC